MTSNLIDNSLSQPTGAQAQGGVAAQQYGISPGQSSYEFVNSAATGTGGDTAALMSGTQWQVGAGGKTVITYSFSHSASVYGFEAGGFSSSLMEFSAADKTATRKLLGNIEAVCNVQFVEIADNGGSAGQIRYAYSQAPNSMGYAGFAFFPSTAAVGGDVWIGKAQAGAEWAYYRPNLILHETLHAIGLKHPFDGAATLGSDDNVIANTVMSYSPIAGATSGALSQYPDEPMPLDVKALQEIYGAATHNEGDTVYNLAALQDGFHAIWDSAGVDTLDAGAVGNSVAIDLHAGARSDIGALVQAFGNYGSGAGRTTGSASFTSTLALSSSAQIENANGSAFDDVLLGNDGANVLSGGAGNDVLIGAGGNDRIIGGDGVDTAGFAGSIANFRIEKVGNEFRVTDRASGQGVDTLSGVEKLRFQEMSIDLTVQDAAAAVAQAQLKSVVELYVGFFNRVPDAEGLSYWLEQMSEGMTTGTVAENFYAAAQVHSGLTGYSAGMSNADFVKVIYKNVLGRTSVDTEGLGYWSNALANGSETRGSLLESILASAHTFKGNAQYGYVADLLSNKFVVGKAFAVDMGLTWNTAEQSITKGMEIAAAVTANDITAALQLIGVAQNDVALG